MVNINIRNCFFTFVCFIIFNLSSLFGSTWSIPGPNIKYNEMVSLVAHNAYSSFVEGIFSYAQQRLSIKDQLTFWYSQFYAISPTR